MYEREESSLILKVDGRISMSLICTEKPSQIHTPYDTKSGLHQTTNNEYAIPSWNDASKNLVVYISQGKCAKMFITVLIKQQIMYSTKTFIIW